jgi:hypothetical protein
VLGSDRPAAEPKPGAMEKRQGGTGGPRRVAVRVGSGQGAPRDCAGRGQVARRLTALFAGSSGVPGPGRCSLPLAVHGVGARPLSDARPRGMGRASRFLLARPMQAPPFYSRGPARRAPWLAMLWWLAVAGAAGGAAVKTAGPERGRTLLPTRAGGWAARDHAFCGRVPRAGASAVLWLRGWPAGASACRGDRGASARRVPGAWCATLHAPVVAGPLAVAVLGAVPIEGTLGRRRRRRGGHYRRRRGSVWAWSGRGATGV